MFRAFLILIFMPLSALIQAKNLSPEWEMKYREITGEYAIYGGELGDPSAPQDKDKNIAFALKGKVAKEMFEAMGPDMKDACTAGSGARVRSKDAGRLSCILYPKDGYVCHFGFGLNTGKSIGGSLC